MRSVLMLLLCLSAMLVLTGVHEQRLREESRKTRVAYRYVPRSAIDVQFSGNQASAQFQGMFEGKSPWLQAQTREEEVGRPIPGFESTFAGARAELAPGGASDSDDDDF